jgi:Family of unknown function (DUF6111)
MVRLVAFNAVVFLLPFALYAGWLWLMRGSANNPADWPLKTIGYLALGGAIVMVASLVFFLQVGGAPPQANYRPATIGEDGRIVPGQLE